MTAAAVLGVRRERALADRGVLAALEEEHQDQHLEERGRLVAQTVELFRRRPLHWIPAPGGRFVLTLGDSMLALAPMGGERWRVLLQERRGIQVLAENLPLAYAQGTAEDHARKVGAGALIDPNASWRAAPATDRQLAALRKWRIPAQPDLTKGEASDLLAAAFAGAS